MAVVSSGGTYWYPFCKSMQYPLLVAPWLKQRHWSSFMIFLYKVCVVQVKGVQYGAEGVQYKLRKTLCFVPFSLYCSHSACTAHTVYWVIIIVFIGMPSLDTSRIWNKMAHECHFKCPVICVKKLYANYIGLSYLMWVHSWNVLCHWFF